MKTKTIILSAIMAVTMIFNSCSSSKKSSEIGQTTDTLSLNEIVKINAEKQFHIIRKADSLNNVTTDVLAIDSFTFKQNIDFRKNQINDSIKLTNIESKRIYYKKTIYLLDSIEKSLSQHVNDYISYKYKYTKYTKSPKDTLYEVNKMSIKSTSMTASVDFYTDATPTRQIIWSTKATKDKILNPVEYPDYYKRIDRDATRK
jgi:hypothetical protein